MYLLESFHIFVFLLDTVLVKLINFRRAKNVPPKISKTFGAKLGRPHAYTYGRYFMYGDI